MTEASNVTRSLYESERAFRLLVEGVVDYAIFFLDPNGIVASWNSGASRIKGYSASEIIGQHFSVFYPEEERAAGAHEHTLREAREKGRYEAEAWRLRKDGSRFFASVVIDAIYEDGALVGFAKITRDITERRNSVLAVQESENRFRMLVSGVTDYALYMLDPDGIITNWNLGGQRIKGYLPEEIIGENFARFYTPGDRESGKPARALQIAREKGRYEEEGWRVRKDGTFFWASVIIDPIRDDNGKLVGYAKITRDITERREAQQKLERVRAQLAESQKLDALGQLTGGVAHDFNNLLMVVAGSIQMIKRLASEPRILRAANAIETAVERGTSLTRQLLTFARRQHVNPQIIEVGSTINAVREVLNTGLGSGIALVVNVPPQAWPVRADPTEFETALVNLVINARDAMPEGGVVTITATNHPSEAGSIADDRVAITVADSGVGIAADVLDKVFDPFFTTKPVGKGTGLGLSQVHGFANQAGGSVKVESEIGKGTRVTILLPREQLDEANIESDAPLGSVLLVEDNPDVAMASAGLLEQLGYAVTWAADAESALTKIELERFNVVFSDIVMPGKLDGLGLAKHIREHHPALPVLLATGFSDAARKSGSDFPILRKPYQLQELSRALATLLR